MCIAFSCPPAHRMWGGVNQEEPITQQETDREPQIEVSEPENDPEAEETETQQELTGEGDGNADSSPIFTMDNPVIYDAEGVTVTVDEITLEEYRGERRLLLTVSIMNNNPDNKKVSFDMNCFVNGYQSGIGFDTGEYVYGGIASGESFLWPGYIPVGAVDKLFREFGEIADEEYLPIAYIDCCYKIQIGSDGDWTEGYTMLKNTQYSVDELLGMFGDKINEASIYGLTFEVYAKQNEMGSTLITVKQTGNGAIDFYGMEYYPEMEWGIFSVNGNDISRNSNLLLSVEKMGNYENGVYYFYLLSAPDEIRRQMEISNDTPLDVSLTPYLNLNMKYGSVFQDIDSVTIPISIE